MQKTKKKKFLYSLNCQAYYIMICLAICFYLVNDNVFVISVFPGSYFLIAEVTVYPRE